MNKELLLVDDDTLIWTELKELTQAIGIQLSCVANGEKALALINSNPNRFAVALVDYNLPDTPGSSVCSAITKINRHVMTMMFSGDDSMETIHDSYRTGGVERFIAKHEGLSSLKQKLVEAFNHQERNHAHRFTLDLKATQARFGLVGKSKAMTQISERLEKLARNSYPVLVLGETGVGKEVIARAIHRLHGGTFFDINCGALPISLAGSELFGHEKGAFTGADKTKVGAFELAQGGVLLLDELHGLNRETQISLLRALAEKEIRRIGGVRNIPFQVKVVATSKPNVTDLVMEDLYHRLRVFEILIPPIRERREDIEPLLIHFLKLANKTSTSHFDEDAIRFLETYSWPGNVREIQNFVTRAIVESTTNNISKELAQEILNQSSIASHTAVAANADTYKQWKNYEPERLRAALRDCRGNIARTATALEIPRATLYDKIKQYNINIQDYR